VKNRNHWFKAKPGDDARAFQDVDVDTEGFIWRLRRAAHDRSPYGFLVDHRGCPYDDKRIADICFLNNNRAKILITEARSAQLIQTVAEFLRDLENADADNKRAKNKLAIFREVVATLAVSPDGVWLMPTLVDDFLDTEANRRFGKRGGNPTLKSGKKTGPRALTGVVNQALIPVDKAQKSESKSLSESSSNDDVVRDEADRRGEDPENVAYVRDVLNNLAPKLRVVGDNEISNLISEYGVAAITVTVAEKRAYLSGKGAEYIEVMMETRRREGWTCPADARAFVDHAMQRKTGYVVRITMIDFIDEGSQIDLFDTDGIAAEVLG